MTRTRRHATTLVQATLVAAFLFAVGSGKVPLGVPGEWEWPRIRFQPESLGIALSVIAVLGYAAFARVGLTAFQGLPAWPKALGWLTALGLAAIAIQLFVLNAAPLGHGLTKWVTLDLPGSSGYFSTARSQIHDPARFWADYPEWIAHQDSLHIGTHPPGLLLGSHALLSLTKDHPSFVQRIDRILPDSVTLGFRTILGPLPRSERAAIVIAGALTLLGCALTVLPLFALARAFLTPSAAWCVAAFWPLLPSAILFQPTSDTAFPFPAATALALAAWGTNARFPLLVASGITLGIGLQFSLVFAPIAVIAGVLILIDERSVRRAIPRLAALVSGFFGVTLALWALSGANPFVIWWRNARNHERFYAEFPRSFGPWLLENPIELAVGIGLPIALLIVLGLRSVRTARLTWLTLAVLVLLTLTRRNLGEVGRLWLPFFPALLIAAGCAIERDDRPSGRLCWTITLLAVQTIALQWLIQVVYPF